MFQTKYKSEEELQYSLRNFQKVGIISCNVCCNLSDCGGQQGLELMSGFCRNWGKAVVADCLIFGGCVGTVHEHAVKKRIYPHQSDIDALVMISCAAGIKTANLYSPGLPVVAACDSFGSYPLSPRQGPNDSLTIHTYCPICPDGHCVMSYTAGICPVVLCPEKCRYGYCENPPQSPNRQCTKDENMACVWKTIEETIAQRGESLDSLKELEQIHADKTLRRMPTPETERAAGWQIKMAQWFSLNVLNRVADSLHAAR